MFKYLNCIKSINDLLLIVFHVIIAEKVLFISKQKKHLFDNDYFYFVNEADFYSNPVRNNKIKTAASAATFLHHCTYCNFLNVSGINNCNDKSLLEILFVLLPFQLFKIKKCQCFHRKEIRRKKLPINDCYYQPLLDS